VAENRAKKNIWCGDSDLIFTVYFFRWENSRNEIKLTLLPLNGGHSVFVDAAGRQNDWLIDCGNETPSISPSKNFCARKA